MGVLSIIAIIALACTHILNIQNMENQDRNVDSYHDWSPYIYIFCGIIFMIVAFFTYRFHILAGVIPIGMGMLLLSYGVYIALVKNTVI